MDSLIFALKAVTPLVALVAIGYFLKKVGLMDGDLAKQINRLVFRVFLPTTIPFPLSLNSRPAPVI